MESESTSRLIGIQFAKGMMIDEEEKKSKEGDFAAYMRKIKKKR